MNRTTARRLERLEEASPANTGKVHTFLCQSHREAREKEAALRASPEWSEGDMVMPILLVGVENGKPLVHP
jgi:hypothetical protein